jgi:hypothetical protein
VCVQHLQEVLRTGSTISRVIGPAVEGEIAPATIVKRGRKATLRHAVQMLTIGVRVVGCYSGILW